MKNAFIINPNAPMVDLLNHARFISSRINSLSNALITDDPENAPLNFKERSNIYATIGYLAEQQGEIIDRLFQLRPSDADKGGLSHE